MELIMTEIILALSTAQLEKIVSEARKALTEIAVVNYAVSVA